LLLDEVTVYLHQRTALETVNILKTIPGIQVVMATHSPTLLMNPPLHQILSCEECRPDVLSSTAEVEILGAKLSAIDLAAFKAHRQILLVENDQDFHFIKLFMEKIHGITLASAFQRHVTLHANGGRQGPKELWRIIKEVLSKVPGENEQLKAFIVQDRDYNSPYYLSVEAAELNKLVKQWNMHNKTKPVEITYIVYKSAMEPENFVLPFICKKYLTENNTGEYQLEFESQLTKAKYRFGTEFFQSLDRANNIVKESADKQGFPELVTRFSKKDMKKYWSEFKPEYIVDAKHMIAFLLNREYCLNNVLSEINKDIEIPSIPEDVMNLVESLVNWSGLRFLSDRKKDRN